MTEGFTQRSPEAGIHLSMTRTPFRPSEQREESKGRGACANVFRFLTAFGMTDLPFGMPVLRLPHGAEASAAGLTAGENARAMAGQGASRMTCAVNGSVTHTDTAPAFSAAVSSSSDPGPSKMLP